MMSEFEQGDREWEHMNSRCGPTCPHCRIDELEAENQRLQESIKAGGEVSKRGVKRILEAEKYITGLEAENKALQATLVEEDAEICRLATMALLAAQWREK